jgi:uncharacterized membrane protein YgdD (TMEM256/DUF423 family)
VSLPPSARLALFGAALNGLLAVALGAFAAHGAGARAAELIATGSRYQLAHAAALLGLAAFCRLPPPPPDRGAAVAAILLAVGPLLFALPLYGLAAGGPGWLGAVAPAGGIAMMAGWAAVLVLALRPRA